MQIRTTFATAIQERIEPVVKVADRRPGIVSGELSNLVVTPQWERYLRQVLDAYTDAADREDEQGIGIWISGFFGSGKSLLMKVLGVLLEGREIDGRPASAVFLDRLPAASPERADLTRFLNICARKISTTAVGGNLHAMLSSQNDPLALIAFKLFAGYRDYTANWPLAWAVEYQIDARGRNDLFRTTAARLGGVEWEEIAADPEFYLEHLYQAAVETLPEHFTGVAAVERAVAAVIANGITPQALVERFRRWCTAQDTVAGEGGAAEGAAAEGSGRRRRHKLLLQLDELGQWIAAGNAGSGSATDRIMQVQALAETAAIDGGGRIWIAVTAHGDVQALQQNVQQQYYAKIIQRFPASLRCKLSNEDISQVVEERLLRKTQPARSALEERFNERSGELADLGSVRGAQRVYPVPDAPRFALFYPYLPWAVAAIPDVVKGIALATGRDESLTGSNRTMIGVVQGAIIETPGLLESPVGRLLALADLYDQLSSDVAIETKTDLNRIGDSVPDATRFTVRVARALFLLGQAKYIPTTLDNVARAAADSLDVNLAALSRQVKLELERLVGAGYAKQVGDQYIFLSTQQRGFQDKVRTEQERLLSQSYELIQALRDYEGEEALRFERVPLAAGSSEREMPLKLEIDGRVARNPTAHVAVRVYSPLQRSLDPQISDDAALRQRSSQDPDNILYRLAEAPGLRANLALAVATAKVADETIGSAQTTPVEKEIARQAKAEDLPALKDQVRRLLSTAVRGGQIFFRGTAYQVADGESASAAARATLSQILPQIYTRFAEVPHRLASEATAVRAALAGNMSNGDLQALGVYRADGTLNESHSLISALRGRLPLAEQDQAPAGADDLRAEFEKPPFGWDGNCVKVALALLLRAAGCRLIENGVIFTDPNAPAVVELLTKEQRFRGLRVQGVRSELGIPELMQIRGYVETIFGVTRLPLVAATLNNALGQALGTMAGRAGQVRAWAATAQCPLPQAFEASTELVGELVNNPAQNVRLVAFRDQADRLVAYATALDALATFQREQGATFTQGRDFYNRMVNASVDLADLRHFLEDWRAVIRERSVTDPQRWNEVMQAYGAAQRAVSEQIARWQEGARRQLESAEAGIEAGVRAAGVPDEHVAGEAAALSALFGDVRAGLNHPGFGAQPALGLYEAQRLLSDLAAAKLGLRARLGELRGRYQVLQEPAALHLRWQDLAGQARIQTRDDLDQLLARVRDAVLSNVDDQTVIIIE